MKLIRSNEQCVPRKIKYSASGYSGAGLVEYLVIVFIIGIAAIAGLLAFSAEVNALLNLAGNIFPQ